MLSHAVKYQRVWKKAWRVCGSSFHNAVALCRSLFLLPVGTLFLQGPSLRFSKVLRLLGRNWDNISFQPLFFLYSFLKLCLVNCVKKMAAFTSQKNVRTFLPNNSIRVSYLGISDASDVRDRVIREQMRGQIRGV